MAELATIARPYAEALFKAAGAGGAQLMEQMSALAALAGDAGLRQYASNPKVSSQQVFELIVGLAQGQGVQLGEQVSNLLRMVLDNGRLPALPEVNARFLELVNAQSGVRDALVESAFPIGDAELADLMLTLEKRFSGRLSAHVELRPELIGGVRVTVGDEVLDASVKARIEHMKLALTA